MTEQKDLPDLETYLTRQFHDYGGSVGVCQVIDFALRTYIDADGNLCFYIHPASVNGETTNFKVEGGKTTPTATCR